MVRRKKSGKALGGRKLGKGPTLLETTLKKERKLGGSRPFETADQFIKRKKAEIKKMTAKAKAEERAAKK